MKKVEMYTQPDCPPCEIVKQFFKHYHIAYTEYNIQIDENARHRLVHEYHSYSTPTVVINDAVVAGFDISRLQQLLGISE